MEDDHFNCGGTNGQVRAEADLVHANQVLQAIQQLLRKRVRLSRR